MYSCLSLATRTPEQLELRQWFCHIDRLEVEPGQCLAASVLYLFRDPSLGGTSFYVATRSPPKIVSLVQDSTNLSAAEFAVRHAVRPGYMTGSKRYFEKVLTVTARWNRLIFYDGGVFHYGQIDHPEKLTPDPLAGRLTLNGFFICRRSLQG